MAKSSQEAKASKKATKVGKCPPALNELFCQIERHPQRSDLVAASEVLRHIAAVNDGRRHFQPLFKLPQINVSDPRYTAIFGSSEFLFPIAIYADEKGLLQIHRSISFDSLVGVEAQRIRQCQFCSKIFYATRSNKRACSKSCRSALEMRKVHAKLKELVRDDDGKLVTKNAAYKRSARKARATQRAAQKASRKKARKQ